MIWCINNPKAHIHTFCKRWSFIWRCFFRLSILKYSKVLWLQFFENVSSIAFPSFYDILLRSIHQHLQNNESLFKKNWRLQLCKRDSTTDFLQGIERNLSEHLWATAFCFLLTGLKSLRFFWYCKRPLLKGTPGIKKYAFKVNKTSPAFISYLVVLSVTITPSLYSYINLLLIIYFRTPKISRSFDVVNELN